MIRLVFFFFLCGTLLVAALVGQTVRAQEQAPMTEEQIEHIRKNCISAQTVLNQLHASDALLWVNRYQLYKDISTDLMAPLSSRIALNRYDGLKLAATSLEFDRKLESFRGNYKNYEEAMSKTLKIRCIDQPVTFYDGVKDTREKRQKVNNDTNDINNLLNVYGTNFEEFAKIVQGGSE